MRVNNRSSLGERAVVVLDLVPSSWEGGDARSRRGRRWLTKDRTSNSGMRVRACARSLPAMARESGPQPWWRCRTTSERGSATNDAAVALTRRRMTRVISSGAQPASSARAIAVWSRTPSRCATKFAPRSRPNPWARASIEDRLAPPSSPRISMRRRQNQFIGRLVRTSRTPRSLGHADRHPANPSPAAACVTSTASNGGALCCWCSSPHLGMSLASSVDAKTRCKAIHRLLSLVMRETGRVPPQLCSRYSCAYATGPRIKARS